MQVGNNTIRSEGWKPAKTGGMSYLQGSVKKRASDGV